MNPATLTVEVLGEVTLEELIKRASRMIDLACGVSPGYFEAADSDAVATSQTIYGSGGQWLRLPPYVPGSITSVTFPDGYTALEYIERDGYLVRKTADGFVASQWIYPSGWYDGIPIAVTAKWGYEETPDDVKHAVIEMVINLWRETDPATVKMTNIEGQVIRESLPPRVKEVVKRYRMKEAVFA
jgi:hypothetical protein